MQEGEHGNISCTPANYSCCLDYHNGYFGKPTKLRTLEPSMFQILTWVEYKEIKLGAMEREMPPLCCNCKCSMQNQAPIRQKQVNGNKHEQKHMYTANQTQKKIKEEQYKLKQSQKGYQNNSKQVSIPGEKLPKENNYLRPKSAGPVPKRINETKYEPKVSKVVQNQPYQQVEEEPLQTKQKLIEQFKQTTRWIPNSSFTTYFGKPAFENYGRGNTNPTYGGLMYGNYLRSHNVQPHRGQNSPKNVQSYNVALMKGHQMGVVYPYPPKGCLKESAVNQNKIGTENMQSSCQIYQQLNNQKSLPISPPNLYDLQKFGGKGLKKHSRTNRMERSNATEKQNQYIANEYGNARKYGAY